MASQQSSQMGAAASGFEVVGSSTGGMSDAAKRRGDAVGADAPLTDRVVRYLPEFDIKRLEHMQVMYQVNDANGDSQVSREAQGRTGAIWEDWAVCSRG